MHKLVLFLVTAAVTLPSLDWGSEAARADEGPAVSHKRARQVCTGPNCGPYAPCSGHCRVICPGGYSCHPLYGAYGPYGGVGYWGAYTFTGWGPAR